jgi:hypothetical protein
LNINAGEILTQHQLDTISKAENYPTNLMRRILADLECYPSPDRKSDILNAFSKLNEPWAHLMLNQFQHFLSIDLSYQEMVDSCRLSKNPLSQGEYYGQIRCLYESLPFTEIQEILWIYLQS